MPISVQHGDFELAFVIRRSRLTQPDAERRLNALENTIAARARVASIPPADAR